MADRSVETEQGTVAYSATGSGEPMVMLSGFHGDRMGWVRSGYPDLLSDYRVLSIDPLGFGLSSKPHDAAAYGAEQVVSHVTSVLDAEDVESAHIWGFSRGGQIAALCGDMAPDRCTSVIMGGAPIGKAVELTLPPLLENEPLLAAGDWATYFARFPVPLPKVLTDHFEATNDPLACAAVIRGMQQYVEAAPDLGLADTAMPRFAYFGSGELFADSLRDVLASTSIETFEGPWEGHAETMLDAPGVVAAVLDFVATV